MNVGFVVLLFAIWLGKAIKLRLFNLDFFNRRFPTFFADDSVYPGKLISELFYKGLSFKGGLLKVISFGFAKSSLDDVLLFTWVSRTFESVVDFSLSNLIDLLRGVPDASLVLEVEVNHVDIVKGGYLKLVLLELFNPLVKLPLTDWLV